MLVIEYMRGIFAMDGKNRCELAEPDWAPVPVSLGTED